MRWSRMRAYLSALIYYFLILLAGLTMIAGMFLVFFFPVLVLIYLVKLGVSLVTLFGFGFFVLLFWLALATRE